MRVVMTSRWIIHYFLDKYNVLDIISDQARWIPFLSLSIVHKIDYWQSTLTLVLQIFPWSSNASCKQDWSRKALLFWSFLPRISVPLVIQVPKRIFAVKWKLNNQFENYQSPWELIFTGLRTRRKYSRSLHWTVTLSACQQMQLRCDCCMAHSPLGTYEGWAWFSTAIQQNFPMSHALFILSQVVAMLCIF